MNIQLQYTDRHGASCTKYLGADTQLVTDAMDRLRRRHIEADLFFQKDTTSEKVLIGRVYLDAGKWNYAFDARWEDCTL